MSDFGRYRITRALGRSGLAEISLAECVELDGFTKEVVIERLLDDLGGDVGLASAFISDATTAIAVRHSNVAQILDVGQVNGSFFLARERVYGCTLADLMALPMWSKSGLPVPLALLIANEVLAALDALHHSGGSRPLWHGGLEPHHVLLSMDGAVKISGVAMGTVLARTVHTAPERVRDVLGYLAPEQVMSYNTATPADGRCDVFACGVLLWEMIAGRRLHPGNNAAELIERAKEARIEPMGRYRPGTPRELEDLVLGALAREIAWRFPSAKDFSRLIFSYLLRNHQDATLFMVQEFLEEHRAELPTIELTAPTPELIPMGPNPIQLRAALTQLAVSEYSLPPGLSDIVEAFRHNPRLWLLVEMADLYKQSSQNEAALTVYRVAAVLFAQRGLLAHALLCCKRMLSMRSIGEMRGIIAALPTVRTLTADRLHALCYASDGPVGRLVQEMLSHTAPAHGLVGAGTPLLHSLNGNAFAELAQQARLSVHAHGTHIVEENAAGTTMFLIGRGRVVVYASNAQKEPVYLSSLTVGDFFGENSFFTGAPRSATVEALGDVEVFEIDKPLYERAMGDNARTEAALMDFYKERIVNAVLAKSQIFGLLPGEERQALVYKFNLRTFKAGDTIIREGDIQDTIYLIKAGEADVFTSKGGPRTALSTIGPGTLFGEVAALRAIPRTASVVARTHLETLELAGGTFHAVLAARPELQQKINDVIARRARANMDKVMGGPSWRRWPAQ